MDLDFRFTADNVADDLLEILDCGPSPSAKIAAVGQHLTVLQDYCCQDFPISSSQDSLPAIIHQWH